MNPSEDNLLINPNTADLESLSHVPGIGLALAGRIIAARPFARLEDLSNVSGIGAQSLQKLLPHLTLEEAASPGNLPEVVDQPALEAQVALSAEPLEAAEVALVVDAENELEKPDTQAGLHKEAAMPMLAEKELEQEENANSEDTLKPSRPSAAPAGAAETPAIPDTPTGNRVMLESLTRADLVRLVFISSLLSMILAVFITLVILFSINRGSLQFALPVEVKQLSQQIHDLDLKLSLLEGDQAALRTRLDHLESVAGRLNELENVSAETRSLVDSNITQVQALTTQAITLTQQINTVTGQVDTINSHLDSLQSSSDRFQQFFDGLTALLNNLYPKDK
jgi:uncharacterized phage infection (PIP) family protein YhgE